MAWPVPRPFVERLTEPEQRAWAVGLGVTAERVGAAWRLQPDGPAMWGYMSVVWPVRGEDGHRCVLKVGEQTGGTDAEALALAAWDGDGAVRLLRHDPGSGARLLEELDPATDLQHVPDDAEATRALGEVLARLCRTPAPAGLPTLLDEVRRVEACLRARIPAAHDLVGRRAVEAALTGAAQLAGLLAADPSPALVHGDLHHLNVLHTLPDRPPQWLAIDPRPLAGVSEWDVVAPLRNRWADAVATGDPDSALRQRLSALTAIAGLDAELARTCAQLVAVDMVTWIQMESTGGHEPFLPPYEVMATWHG